MGQLSNAVVPTSTLHGVWCMAVATPNHGAVRMQGMLAAFQISSTLGHWVATLLAFALSALSPAPKHASQHHHQPVRLPELASAGPVYRAQ